ncbi:MAG: alkaline phosphatase D family protein [Gammaproteobacteria bacterium]|nr:alkaline phosphatase D family protein [Gammaproteobacteria bacterium]
MNRRQFHQLLLAGVAVELPSQPQFSARITDYPFQLGIASGNPTSSSVILWTRLMTDTKTFKPLEQPNIKVHWEVYADSHLQQLVAQGDSDALADYAHSVRVRVHHLRANTYYWYRFTCATFHSSLGRTKTLPEANSQVSLRFAVANCQNFQHGYFTAYQQIALENLDFVLFLGDYIYEYGPSKSKGMRYHLGPEAKDLAGYRQRHAQYKADKMLQQAHAQHPWFFIWDDHEVQNDYTHVKSTVAEDLSIEFYARRKSAYQAYYEHLPFYFDKPDFANFQLFQNLLYGQSMEFWLLDTRQYKDPFACYELAMKNYRVLSGCEELLWPRSMLGIQQEQWLDQSFTKSTRPWKFIAQTTLVHPGSNDPTFPQKKFVDGWSGYPKARQRLIDTIARNTSGQTIVLGGDIHASAITLLRKSSAHIADKPIATEVVTTSISSKGLHKREAEYYLKNPDFVYFNSEDRGYSVFEVTEDTLVLKFVTTPSPVNLESKFSVNALFELKIGGDRPHKIQVLN